MAGLEFSLGNPSGFLAELMMDSSSSPERDSSCSVGGIGQLRRSYPLEAGTSLSDFLSDRGLEGGGLSVESLSTMQTIR